MNDTNDPIEFEYQYQPTADSNPRVIRMTRRTQFLQLDRRCPCCPPHRGCNHPSVHHYGKPVNWKETKKRQYERR